MKKLLIGSAIVVLCAGAPVVYADDAHHPKEDSASGSSVADVQMGKAQEHMKQARALMDKLRDTKDPAERKKLMRQHTQTMRETMDMMRNMPMGMMGGGQGMGMGMMGTGKGQAPMGGMMPMHQMMEDRMEMMQMMMEQMFERQEMLMQDGK
jgi:hypothetical protein